MQHVRSSCYKMEYYKTQLWLSCKINSPIVITIFIIPYIYLICIKAGSSGSRKKRKKRALLVWLRSGIQIWWPAPNLLGLNIQCCDIRKNSVVLMVMVVATGWWETCQQCCDTAKLHCTHCAVNDDRTTRPRQWVYEFLWCHSIL